MERNQPVGQSGSRAVGQYQAVSGSTLEALKSFDLGLYPLECALSGRQHTAVIQRGFKSQLSEFPRSELCAIGCVGHNAHGLLPLSSRKNGGWVRLGMVGLLSNSGMQRV